jgi:protein-S-isoprenylcysteine O-methyltransferase Ste14
MNAKKVLRHIAGFLFGGTVFALLIPFGLYHLSDVDRLLGLPTFAASPLRLIPAVLVGAVGLLFVFWSNLFLVTRGKGGPAEGFGVAVSPRTEKLVVTGPYRWSRNPMVFGAFASYTALAFLWGTITGLIVLALFFPFAVFYLKRSEETRLLKDFGKEYEEYRKRVSMIVPWPKRGGRKRP